MLKEIVRDSNWKSVDLLDGVKLCDGESLIIEWPNGEMQVVNIGVDVGTVDCHEQGGVWHGERSEAYFWTSIRGAVVKVPLVGFRAQRTT